MSDCPTITADTPLRLSQQYAQVRTLSEQLCAPLAIDDYQIQSAAECSPPKWHLAHVSWFFETFLLIPFVPGYRPFHAQFEYLFNSYYETVGKVHPRPNRGFLSRPTVEEVYAYRKAIDTAMFDLLDASGNATSEIMARVTLGIQHEQQHQELLLMDIQHHFWMNPLRPSYSEALPRSSADGRPQQWLECHGGTFTLGHQGDGFSFDNETPPHEILLPNYLLADKLVTNAEYMAFMDDGGYAQPELWLADGWQHMQQNSWTQPLYWERVNGDWQQMTLAGMQAIEPTEPVCHVSFYEADAFARWAGCRLPTEAELEINSRGQPVVGNFMDDGRFHPQTAAPGANQWYGDTWEWTSSPYAPYAGFKPLAGAIGEYNGKFMCNQMVLRGGSCLTPASHMRASYRNFFYPHDRWPVTGIRLARNPLD